MKGRRDFEENRLIPNIARHLGTTVADSGDARRTEVEHHEIRMALHVKSLMNRSHEVPRFMSVG